jgi:hypothetical protein
MNNEEECIPGFIDPDDGEEAVYSMLHCPVKQYANNVTRSGKETLRGLRLLRKSLMNCEICSAFGQCQLREHFNMQVDQVIAQIVEEWGWD